MESVGRSVGQSVSQSASESVGSVSKKPLNLSFLQSAFEVLCSNHIKLASGEDWSRKESKINNQKVELRPLNSDGFLW